MAGTSLTGKGSVTDVVRFYQSGALAGASAVMGRYVCLFRGRIAAIAADAGTAGTGTGNSVLDVRINGTSVYTTTGNRPTLLATSTGAFANVNPDGTRAFRPGDVIDVISASISDTGHAATAISIGLTAE